MNATPVRSLPVLGVDVSAFDSYSHAVAWTADRIAAGKKTFCVAINPEKVYRAGKDQRLASVLESAHMRICDGAGVSLACLLLHGRTVPRCTGVDLFLHLMNAAAAKQWSIFVLGASPEANRIASDVLAKRFPGLKVAGRQDGFFKDDAAVVQAINRSGADILFVAMGSPRQEYWIAEHMGELRPTFCMGVGGTLDVVSGIAKRAPALFRKTGTEWFYRLALQPSRFRRQLALPLFAFEVFKSFFRPGAQPAVVQRKSGD
jgi:N-acetylglucosaminyldiphosphoundecaprenol N-acetyl-beta-D-mannosaminyltransferase